MSKGAKIAITVVLVGALVYWYYTSTAVAPAANSPTGAGSSPSTGGGTSTTTLPNGNTLGVSPTGLTINGTNITPTSGQAPNSLNPLALFTPAQAATRAQNVAVSLSDTAYATAKANRPTTGAGAAGTSSTGYVAPSPAATAAANAIRAKTISGFGKL